MDGGAWYGCVNGMCMVLGKRSWFKVRKLMRIMIAMINLDLNFEQSEYLYWLGLA